MSRLFFSGFETGDLSEFLNITGTPTAQGTTVRSGAYALKCSTDGDSLLSKEFASQTTIYARFFFRFSAAPGDVTIIARFANGANDVCYLALDTARKLRVMDSTFSSTTGSTVLSTNTWYRLELKAVISGGVTLDVKIDGAAEASKSGNAGDTVISNIGFQATALNALSVSSNLFFDDISVESSGYPGDGRVIARQFTSGTPTYNSMTKTGGSGTIDSVWNDTPYSTSKFAVTSSTTGQVAQTGLIASFSSTQSGHGTETIASGDTINGIKIGAIAKTSSTANNGGDGAVRRVIGGVTTDVSVIIDTTDAYYETPIFTTSLSNLNAGEAGWNKRTSTAARTHTVEDVWTLVDYTAAGGTSVSVNLTGSSASASAGSFTVTGAANVSMSGLAVSALAGGILARVGTDITVSLTGASSTVSAGTPSVSGKASVSLTGSSFAVSAGSLSVTGKANVSLLGQSASVSAGTISATIGVLVRPTGASASVLAGSLIVVGNANPAVYRIKGRSSGYIITARSSKHTIRARP